MDKINEILAEGFGGLSRHLTRHKGGGAEMLNCGISATLSVWCMYMFPYKYWYVGEKHMRNYEYISKYSILPGY